MKIEFRPKREERRGGLSLLVAAVVGGALGGLISVNREASWRPYWHLFMIGGAAAGTLAVCILDLKDALDARRGTPDKGQLPATLQSLLLAFLIFAIISIVCCVLVFAR